MSQSVYYQKNKTRPWSRKKLKTRNYERTESKLGQSVQEYLLNSTFHGLRYVGDTKISYFERIFFVAAFVFVLSLSIYFISHVYNKWTASPVIIALNAVATSIGDIPFPAVTICNMNQARLGAVKNWSRHSDEYLLLKSLCRRDLDGGPSKANNTSWSFFRNFLIKVSQSCDDMLITCKFGQKWETCSDIFETVLTDEGLCCSFNSVDKKFLLLHDTSDDFENNTKQSKLEAVSWTPEDGYQKGTPNIGIYPRRGLGSGSHMGLTVLVSVFSDDYYCSSTNSAGFKVLLHPPTETPKIADYGFSITPGIESRVVITPRISDASPLIRKVPYNQRQCVFSNEGNLSYFRKNCEMECESRLLSAACGCVLYYMPRLDDNAPICSRDDQQCAVEIKLAIEMSLNSTFRCDCLPGCFEINYRPDISIAALGSGFSVAQMYLSKTTKAELQNYSVMHVFYEDNLFRSNSKEELIGFTEFLSNTGGLLGLFMGFSVVSLIEIIYFMSIRPYCAAKRKRRSYRRTRIRPAEDERMARIAVEQLSKMTTISQSIGSPFVVRFNPTDRRSNNRFANWAYAN